MTTIDGATGADSRAHAERMLARYPDLSATELNELRHWFRKQASALDVAHVASNDAITDQYRAFRATHIDRFTPNDLMAATVFVMVVSLCVLALLWRAI